MFIKDLIKQILPQKLTWKICNIIPHQPLLSDISKSERICEYAWILTKMDKLGKVLDIGYCGSLFPKMLASLGHKVWAIDKKKMLIKHPNLKTEQININYLGLYKNYFDYITIISTLEHTKELEKICIDKSYNALKKGGKLLVTVPIGKSQIFNGYKVYNRNQIKKLIGDFITDETYFKELKPGIWIRSSYKDVKNILMEEKGHVKAIGCFELTK